jgi:2-dehydro-3-deoxygalactonokinase
MSKPAVLACDWGTTNLRAWVVGDDGKVVRSRDFPLGVAKLAPGEAAKRFRDEVRPGLVAEDLPAILCGMIGSTLGWAVADYLPCPAGVDELRGSLLQVEGGRHPVYIVPGLRCAGPTGASDVMRGEETQAIGWIARAEERRHGRWIVCHPGTHAKWIEIIDGRVTRFVTAMTGELFAVMSHHSVLKTDAQADDPVAFDEGLAAAGDGSALATRLFSARARVVADGKPEGSAAAYLSGLLIGAEVASAPGLLGISPDTTIALVGEPGLCRWYARALGQHPHTIHNGDKAALAGLAALHRETVS